VSGTACCGSIFSKALTIKLPYPVEQRQMKRPQRRLGRELEPVNRTALHAENAVYSVSIKRRLKLD
jgi:hypothetical protein